MLHKRGSYNLNIEQPNEKSHEKLVMISDKYSIDHEQTGEKRHAKIEESKEHILPKQSFGINIGLRNYHLDDIMVKMPDSKLEERDEVQHDKISKKNLHGRQPSFDTANFEKEKIKKEPSEGFNNNLDLDSVRSAAKKVYQGKEYAMQQANFDVDRA